MRRNLLLTIALAVAGTAVVGGSAVGADRLLNSGSSGVDVNIPGGENLPPIGSLPACSNLKDDDGDGKVDLGDPGCSGPNDGDEYNPAPQPPPDPTDPPDPDDPGNGGGGNGNGGGGEPDPGDGNAGPGGGGGGGKGQVKKDKSDEVDGNRKPMDPPEQRNPDGTPTQSNPTATFANCFCSERGMPNFSNVLSSSGSTSSRLAFFAVCFGAL